MRQMQLGQALQIIDHVVSSAQGPVSVFVADDHGEIIAAATMDGAAPDTRLNAQRKAYTAARSDARSTAELPRRPDDGRAGASTRSSRPSGSRSLRRSRVSQAISRAARPVPRTGRSPSL
jgi:uncharacterized protein GlcG (DUF336 family)